MLKGQCHEIFDLNFLHESNPSRPLINRLNIFEFCFDFTEIFEFLKSSAVCIPLGTQTPRCVSSCGVRLRGVHHTVESDSAVCIIPWSQTPRCASHCGVMKTKYLKKLCGVHPTTESDSAVCIPPRNQAPRCASQRGVSNLLNVCFDPKFYDCYFSVMP